MSSWFDTGRRAIFESLTEACDRIEGDLDAGRQTRPSPYVTYDRGPLTSTCRWMLERKRTQHELESLAAEVDRLARENKNLRTQLSQFQQNRDVPQTPQGTRPLLAGQQTLGRTKISGHNKQHLQPITPQSINKSPRSCSPFLATVSDDDVDWKQEAAKNAIKYSRMRTELDTAKDALVKRRDEVDNWKTYAENLEKKVATLEAQHGTPIVFNGASANGNPEARAQEACQNISSETERGGNTSAFTERDKADRGAEPSTSLGSMDAVQMRSSPPRRAGGSKPQEDSCPTQSDSTEENQEHTEMTLPELIREENLPLEPKIKQEPSSDSPVVVSERSVRKRKRTDREDQHPSPLRVKREDNESDPLVTADLCDFSPATSIDLDESGTGIIDTPHKNRQLDAIRTAVLSAPRTSLRNDPGPENKSSASRALQPLSPNVCRPRPQRPLKKGIGHAVAELAEDGGIYEAPAKQQLVPPRTEPTAGRLAGLLNRSVVEPESPLIRQRARLNRARGGDARDTDWPQVPRPRELPFGKQPRDKLKGQEAKIPRASTASPGCGTTRHETLASTPAVRSKPPSDLRLEDFKINPNFNNGYDYAYTEVVRNKDDRACIPGCVDMDCCGKHFRAMAIAERGTGARTPAQSTEDRRLLENYLGDEAYRLFSMTKEEKDEVWLEAKTKELADRIGKHRHRFSRMKSPPGFWRTDFPNTQEEEQDKAAAAQREKDMIQERYREAMRPGGKWVFKDG